MKSIIMWTMAYIHGAKDQSTRIYIDIYDEDNSPLSQAVVSDLTNYKGVFAFQISDSKNEVLTHVENNSVNCGYIIKPGLTDAFSYEKGKNSIDVIISPGSYLSSVVNEIIYSIIFREYSSIIAYNYLDKSNIVENISSPDIKKDIEDIYNYNIENSVTMVASDNLSTYKDSTITTYKYNIPIKAMGSLLILIFGISGIYMYKMDSEKSLYARFSIIKKLGLYISSIYTSIFFISLSVALSLIIIKQENIFKELLSLLIFTIVATVYLAIYGSLFKTSRTYISTVPTYLLTVLLFTPVFKDISKYIPVLKYIGYFFPNYFYLK